MDEDEALEKELDDMRQFLLKEEEEGEEEGWKKTSGVLVRDARTEFVEAAGGQQQSSSSLQRLEDDEEDPFVSILGRRSALTTLEEILPPTPPVELREEHFSSSSSGGSPVVSLNGEELAVAASGGGGDRLVSYSAGFLKKGQRVTTTAASAGLYDDNDAAASPPKRLHAAAARDEGVALTYKEFLAKLMLPYSAELVSHIRAFVVFTLDEARSTEDAIRARKPGAVQKRRETLDSLPSRCATFFAAAEAHLERHPEWKKLGHAGLTSSRFSLEKYVMTKLGAFAFEACRNDDQDERFRRRCRALGTFVTAEHLDVKPALCNEVVMHIARDELRRMDACRAPSDKVECVVKCASVIFSALNLCRAENSSQNGGVSESRAGADDFLPVFIYVVLKADAPRLVSNCDYIQAFHNPDALMSKSGYCFVNLRSSIEFLSHLTGDQIGMDNEDFERRLELAYNQAT